MTTAKDDSFLNRLRAAFRNTRPERTTQRKSRRTGSESWRSGRLSGGYDGEQHRLQSQRVDEAIRSSQSFHGWN